MPVLGIQQYGKKQYCVLLFEILQHLASYWQREGVHVNSAQSTSYEVQNIGSLGDLRHD